MLVIVCPGQGSQTPGFLTPWLELPGVRDRLGWLSAVAGLDLVAHGTVSDADTIKDTAVAQPLIVAAGLVSLLGLFDQPGDAPGLVGAVGAIAGHSRRRDHRRHGGRGAERRAGDGLRPRARPGHGRRERRHRRPA